MQDFKSSVDSIPMDLDSEELKDSINQKDERDILYSHQLEIDFQKCKEIMSEDLTNWSLLFMAKPKRQDHQES